MVSENTKGLSSLEITFWWLSSVSVTVAALCSRVGVMISLVLPQHCHSQGVIEARQGCPRNHLHREGKENNQVLRTDHVQCAGTLFKQGEITALARLELLT